VSIANLVKPNEQTSRLLNKIHEEHYSLAITELRNEIAKPDFMPADSHIFAVAHLGVNQARRIICEEYYPISPLGSLQKIFPKS
jgi:hypothetical protein